MAINLLLILFVTGTTVGGQLLLKHAMVMLAARDPAPGGIEWLVAAFMSPGVWGAIAIQAVGFVVWMVVISRIKLGLAFAIAGASLYLVMALIGWMVYGERLGPTQWAGIALISIGVLTLSLTGQRV